MNRRGFALVFVLYVIAAMELLALSTLALATHEAVAVHAEERTAVARHAAEAGLRRFARDWPHTPVELLAIGASTTMTDTSGVQLTVHRHRWGLYEVRAAAPAGPAFVRQAMVLRTLDVATALQEGTHVMRSAGSAADSLSCALPAALTQPAVWPVPNGYALGGVLWDEAFSVADTIANASVTMSATDTLGAAQPRVLYSPGDLAAAGQGAGILLVNGDLTLLAGAEFTGVMVVRGTVTLAPDAHVTGSVWVQAGAPNPPAGQLTFSPCWSAWALLSSPGSRRLVQASRRFIPAF
jgi:hypothetical protein